MADQAINWQNVFGDFGGAAADLFGASANNSKANADLASAAAARVAGQADRIKSQGDLVEGAACNGGSSTFRIAVVFDRDGDAGGL